MTNKFNDETWIYVVVQDPGGNEQFFGLQDAETDISYIPAFQDKEDAQNCLIHLPTLKGKKYQVQAVMFGDLSRDALANNFFIFILDGDGRIIDKIYPGASEAPVH